MAEWRQGSRHRKLRTPFLNHKNDAESNLKVVGVFLTLKTLFSSSNKVTAPKHPQTAPPTRDQDYGVHFIQTTIMTTQELYIY